MTYDFLIESDDTQRVKALSVWSEFKDGAFRCDRTPDRRGRSVHERTMHQCGRRNDVRVPAPLRPRQRPAPLNPSAEGGQLVGITDDVLRHVKLGVSAQFVDERPSTAPELVRFFAKREADRLVAAVGTSGSPHSLPHARMSICFRANVDP
jgi:hypothetical protein